MDTGLWEIVCLRLRVFLECVFHGLLATSMLNSLSLVTVS